MIHIERNLKTALRNFRGILPFTVLIYGESQIQAIATVNSENSVAI